MEIISSVLIATAVSFFLQYLFSRTHVAPETESCSPTLRADKGIRLMGRLGIFLGIVFLAGYSFDYYYKSDSYTAGMHILILTFCAFLIVGGQYLILFYRNSRVVFDNDKIVSINFLNKSKIIFWKNIEAVEYFSIPRWIVLKDAAHSVYVWDMFRGSKRFEEELSKRIAKEKFQDSFVKAKSIS